MDAHTQQLLALTDHQAQQAWLAQYAPSPNLDLIEALRQAAARRERDNPHTALPIAHIVATAATYWNDPHTRAVALHIEANARQLLAEHKQALALYEQAANIYHTLGQELDAARVAVGQLATLQYLGHYESALALASWAGKVFHAYNDQKALGKMLMNQGNICARLGQFATARTHYAQAQTLFTQLQDTRHLAMLYINDAIALTFLDNFRAAETLFQEARAYFVAEEMTSLTAQVDVNLAYLYFAQGDYQHALATLNQASEIYAPQENPIDLAYVNLHRADNYLALNLWPEALAQTRAARAVFAQAEMSWETAVLWLNEAVALAHIYDDTTPESAFAQARQHFAQAESSLWLAIVDLYQAIVEIHTGKLAQAHSRIQQARPVFVHNELRGRVAHCDVLLGDIARHTTDAAQALHHYTQAQTQLAHTDLPAVAYACQYGLGCVRQQQGQLLQALAHYQQSIVHIERLQAAIGAEDYKMAFLRDKHQVYEAMIQLCLEIGAPAQIATAFATAEQARSRVLLDTMTRDTPSQTQLSGTSALLMDMHQLKRELNWYYNRLYEPQPDAPLTGTQIAAMNDAITHRERALKALLQQWHNPDLATAPRNPVWTVTAAQIQAILPTQTTLLAYFMTAGQFFVFGLNQHELWTVTLPITESQIATTLTQLRFQFNKFHYQPAYRQRHAHILSHITGELLQELHQKLIAPLSPYLADTETLIIIPFGLLHVVPFPALFDGATYLLDRYTISFAPSATILYRTLQRERAGISSDPPLIMAIDDPAIPHAQAETAAITALFPDATVYTGAQAVRTHLTSVNGRPAFLHLSTHATFRSDNPLFSALKLTDGWLSVNDIYGLNLPPVLVTLSACETGRTQVATGDELVGLCRGFFAAGAHAILVSLWMVDDATTAQLMPLFYQQLRAGLPANQALRWAQQQIKANQPHPFYWASFILTGCFTWQL